MNSKKSEKFEYLFKCKRSKFWSQVSRFRKKKPLNSNSFNIDAFEEYYSNCFNSKNAVQLDEHKLIEIEVKERIQSLKNQTYDLRVTPEQLKFAIAQLNTGKAFGFEHSLTLYFIFKTVTLVPSQFCPSPVLVPYNLVLKCTVIKDIKEKKLRNKYLKCNC